MFVERAYKRRFKLILEEAPIKSPCYYCFEGLTNVQACTLLYGVITELDKARKPKKITNWLRALQESITVYRLCFKSSSPNFLFYNLWGMFARSSHSIHVNEHIQAKKYIKMFSGFEICAFEIS